MANYLHRSFVLILAPKITIYIYLTACNWGKKIKKLNLSAQNIVLGAHIMGEVKI
jgi:hypothetical protein